jgi:Helicase conserved C-terminal domain
VTDLQNLLLQYDAKVVKAIAREHGSEVKNQPKLATAQWLAQKLTQREQVEQGLRKLRPIEREVLEMIQRVGGEISSSALKRALEKTKAVSPTPRGKNRWGMTSYDPYQGNPNYSGKPALEDVAARLALLGLAFSRQVAAGYKQTLGWELGRYLVIPEEIRAFLPAPAAEQGTIATEPARVEPGSARTFQRDLSRYWSFVRRAGALSLTAQGYVYKKTLLEIAKALGWQENKKLDEKTNLYPYFLRRMLAALDLLEPEKVNGWANPEADAFLPGEGKAFWSRPPTERVKTSFEAYLDAATWNELRIPKATYGFDHRRAAPPEVKNARRRVVEHLKRQGASEWRNLTDLVDEIRLADYEFLFPRRQRAPAYYGYGSNYGSPYYHANNPFGITYAGVEDEAAGWDRVEGAIITHMVTGPLHWLGLTDIGYDDENDAPRAYRLTAMGAWLLGVGAPVAIAEEGGRVVAQPNFQIVAMEPIAENVLMTLDEFAQFEGGDHALTYRLTRESVYRGQRAGWDAARMTIYLEEVTHTPLPQNVRRSLEEWQQLHERTTFYRGIPLVQTDDATTLDVLLAHPVLAPKLGRRANEVVALPNGNASSVIRALREAGWLPLVTAADQFDAPASALADAEGNVELVQRAPSVYAYEGIEPFAEFTDGRHARITRASVDAAAQQGMSVPTILARLRGVQRGEVPPQLITRIKAWGKYFGDARMGTLTLIEFRDEPARSELLADPELKPHLVRFDAGNRPLALVRDLERVKELLAERGVEIREFEA